MRGFLPYPQEEMSHIDMRNTGNPVGVLAVLQLPGLSLDEFSDADL